MQNSSAFQYLAIDTIHESTTNPRRTFDLGKLQELAESIKHHGLIQPITVRPNSEGFELVAGARRYRAAQLAELFSIPARIVELTDAQSQEWQLVENSQRVDVHPYEEAQGCPVHDPRAAAEQAADPAPTMAPAPEAETEEEAEERQRNYEHQRKEYEQEQERRAEERRQQFEREQQEQEAERVRREKLYKARVSKFDRILDKAPAMFSAAQLRVFLRALVNIDPYTFDDVAEHLTDDENNQQTSEEILLSTIDGLPDDNLIGFALRLVITAHIPIPREGELDYLTEAETAFAPPQLKKAASKKTTTPTPIKAAKKSAAKKTTAKKEVAA